MKISFIPFNFEYDIELILLLSFNIFKFKANMRTINKLRAELICRMKDSPNAKDSQSGNDVDHVNSECAVNELANDLLMDIPSYAVNAIGFYQHKKYLSCSHTQLFHRIYLNSKKQLN